MLLFDYLKIFQLVIKIIMRLSFFQQNLSEVSDKHEIFFLNDPIFKAFK